MTETGAPRRPRITSVVGLFLLFAAASGLALWQATQHLSPTIFTDEAEMTQMARSIAATGRPSLRGLPVGGLAPLGAYVSAPFWWIDDVPTAYTWIKAMNSIIMATVVFPAYGMARLAVRPGWALFAAAGAVLCPALAYAPVLVKEPTAYPVGTLALFLIARWATRPSRTRLLLAFGGCLLGVWAKDQLIVLIPILALSIAGMMWRSERARAFRRTWSRGDWVGAALLVLGLAVVVNAVMTNRLDQWYTPTTFFQDRMFDLGLGAAGALMIGLGLIPLIAGLASLVPPRGEEPRPGVIALRTVTISAIACFGLYTGLKGAYLSTIYATLTLERNLIFLGPLLFAGAALFFQRRGGRWWAVLAAGLFCLYLVRSTPYSLTAYPNYEAHGLAMAAFANRIFRWPADTIETALVAITVATTIVLALLPRLRGNRGIAATTAALAAGALVWSGTAQVYAANGESLFSKRLYGSLTKPANWLDLTVGSRSVTFLGQGIRDPNPIHLLEFWNRSLTGFWSLDGTAPGPGATVTADLRAPDGTSNDPETDFVLATPGVDINAKRIGEPIGGYSLYPSSDGLRLRTALTGVEPDGWMGGSMSFSRYDTPPGIPGRVRIELSRPRCGKDVRSTVTISLGRVGVGATGQPSINEPKNRAYGVLHSCQTKTFDLPTPPGPWRVEIAITPTFSPAALDPRETDRRELGARPTITYSDRR